MVESLITMAIKGNRYALESITEYCLPKLHIFDPTNLNDREDINQLKRIAIWRAIKSLNLDQAKINFVLHRAKYMALNEIPHRGFRGVVVTSNSTEELAKSWYTSNPFSFSPKMIVIKVNLDRAVQDRAKQFNRENILMPMYRYIKQKGLVEQKELAKVFGVTKGAISRYMVELKDLAVQSEKKVSKTLYDNHIYMED